MMHTASKSLQERLLSYLSEQALEHGSSHFTIPFDRQRLADYLAVDRAPCPMSCQDAEGRSDFVSQERIHAQ